MRGRLLAGGVLGIAASVLLIVTLLVGWYTISVEAGNSGANGSGQENFYLGDKFVTTESCSGSSSCPIPTSNTSSYSAGGLHYVGHLYQYLQYAVLGAIGLAIGGVGVLFARGKNSAKVRSLAITFLTVSAALAILVPVLFLILQPGDFAHDLPSSATSYPGNSFFGTCARSACGSMNGSTPVTASWGPGTGWYLAFAAFGLLVFAMTVASYNGGSQAESPRITSQNPSVTTPGADPQLIACRSCGRVYTLGQHPYCPNCGTKLGDK